MSKLDSLPITLHGRFVAIARRERVHLLVDDLSPDESVLVMVMCLYARATLCGDLPEPYRHETAARVAAACASALR